jgi:type 1 fimbria pilin
MNDITIPNFWTTNDLIGPTGMTEPVPIMFPHSYEERVYLFGSQTVFHCENGSDNAVTLTAPSDPSIVSPYTMNGMTLLKTSVPGIVYTYTLRCADDCVSGSSLYLNLPAPGQSVTSAKFNGSYEGSASRWDILVSLFQTPEYRPHPGQTQVAAIAGSIGTVHMGPTNGSSKTMNLNITSGSVLFRLAEPTCQSVGINGMGGTREINFGDFYASDIVKSGATAEKQFTFDLFNCSMNGIEITVNGPHDGTGNYLVNSTGSSSGVGITLLSNITGRGWELAKVDGSKSINQYFTGNVDWYKEHLSIPFTAQFRKVGGAIEAGSFISVATFTLSYE